MRMGASHEADDLHFPLLQFDQKKNKKTCDLALFPTFLYSKDIQQKLLLL